MDNKVFFVIYLVRDGYSIELLKSLYKIYVEKYGMFFVWIVYEKNCM